jgi:hypothetical protein
MALALQPPEPGGGLPVESPVRRSSRILLLAIPAVTLSVALIWPQPLGAQHRGRGRYYHPYYYAPWWGPYGYYPLVNYNVSSLRVAVQPSDAQVFVDGYFAGEVDRFDNIFQRLQLTPGGHEIAIFHEGYRTFRQQLYLEPGGDQKLVHRMEPLAPGEVAEVPAPPPEPAPIAAPPPGRPAGPEPPAEREERVRRVREGTLSLRIVPGDAEIRIGDETWSVPAGQERLTITLAEGRHTLDVRKAGYAPYVQDVLIRRNATLRLTVTLEPVR